MICAVENKVTMDNWRLQIVHRLIIDANCMVINVMRAIAVKCEKKKDGIFLKKFWIIKKCPYLCNPFEKNGSSLTL